MILSKYKGNVDSIKSKTKKCVYVVNFSLFFGLKLRFSDRKMEDLKIRLIYTKPKLRDLSQGSRIVFVRLFRLMTQDGLSDKLVIFYVRILSATISVCLNRILELNT